MITLLDSHERKCKLKNFSLKNFSDKYDFIVILNDDEYEYRKIDANPFQKILFKLGIIHLYQILILDISNNMSTLTHMEDIDWGTEHKLKHRLNQLKKEYV